ncbi:MAG: hypothetical protein SNJ85_08110 [Cyanobacteriota bacterium]
MAVRGKRLQHVTRTVNAMKRPIQDSTASSSRPKYSQGRRRSLQGLGLGLFLASLILGGWAGNPLTWAQEADPEAEVFVPGGNIDPASQIRVRNELVTICGDYRCEGYRFPVRVLISPDDTLETLLERLDTGMLREVDRVFQSRPDLNRVIIDGYVFSGTPTFVSREVLLQTLFVPRHRWEVGRFGLEQDAIFYAELLGQVTPLLTPPQSPESEPEETLPPLPDLPPVTPETPAPEETPIIEETPTPEETTEAPPPPEGDIIERQPIQP